MARQTAAFSECWGCIERSVCPWPYECPRWPATALKPQHYSGTVIDGSAPKVKGKYPLAGMAVDDNFLIVNARPDVRGCLYNRAEVLGIRITVRKEGRGIRVRRYA